MRRGGLPQARVFVLIDENGKTVYVGSCRADQQPNWHFIWENRFSLPGRLAALFRGMKSKPVEKTILGSVAGLHAGCSRAVVRMFAEWFGCLRDQARQSRGHAGKAVGQIKNGQVTIYPTRRQAAEALQITRPAVNHRIETGDLIDLQ